MAKPICIYHGNCIDGFASATVVRMKYGADNVDFHPGVYGEAPPDVTGRGVILVDFSYSRDVIIEMASKAEAILILDHHQTAQKNLVNLPDNVTAIFDMERSGAVMTWNHYYPEEKVPQLLLHVQDRDLWQFKLKGTRQINANLFSHPYSFELWENLIRFANLDRLCDDGEAIERKHFKDIHEFIQAAQSRMVILGYDVPVLNAPYFWSSDAGHIMGVGEPFAVCYWHTMDGCTFSLRSDKDGGIDVAEIAEYFGGGGHKHASGFQLTWEQLEWLGFPRMNELSANFNDHVVHSIN